MVVYLVETGGIRTLIWGDNRHNPPQEFWDAIGQVDVLTLPVDGSEHILSFDQGQRHCVQAQAQGDHPQHIT